METAAQGHPELDGFAESQRCVLICKGEKVKKTQRVVLDLNHETQNDF